MSDVFDDLWADWRTRCTFRREFDSDGSVDERTAFELWVKLKLWGPTHPEVLPYLNDDALAAATGTAKTSKAVECEASQSGPKGNAQEQSA